MRTTRLLLHAPGPGDIVIVEEPFDRLVESLFKWRKLEVADKTEQFLVRGWLPELSICAGGVEDIISFESNFFDNCIGDLLDAHLLVLTDRENQWFDVVVVAQLPDEELGKVTRVDELSQRLSGTGDDKWCSVLFGEDAFMNEARDDMRVFEVEVVIWPKDVGGDRAREVASKLFLVGMVHYIDHALGMRVAKVALVWWTEVDFILVERILDLVWEDAGREARDDFGCLVCVGRTQDVVVDECIVS